MQKLLVVDNMKLKEMGPGELCCLIFISLALLLSNFIYPGLLDDVTLLDSCVVLGALHGGFYFVSLKAI